jgi:Domain of unknown function (DUF4189)
MRTRAIALILLLFTSFFVRAEGNCPDGYYPIGGGNAGWEGCAAYQTAPGAPPPDPGPQWSTRWGAMAVDATTGRFGGAEGHSSARLAKKGAIAACKKNGGTKQCKVMGNPYFNQCGVLASGDTRSNGYSAGTIEEATNLALRECSQHTNNCKIYYTGCSYPQRVN